VKRARPDQTKPLNVKALITSLGGVTKTQVLLIQGGYPLSRNAVEKWIKRNSIPYGRLIQLQDAADYVLNTPLNLAPFYL
jgi:hypothetical protein